MADHPCPACAVPGCPGDLFCEGCGHELRPATATAGSDGVSATGTVGTGPACRTCGTDLLRSEDGYCPTCGTKAPDRRDHLELSLGPVAAVTDRGRRRRNEDAFAVTTTTDGRAIAIVCDGVSTTPAAGEASQRAADTALVALLRSAADAPLEGAMTEAYDAARQAVAAMAPTATESAGAPSCTWLATMVSGDRAQIAWVGDCRALWLPGHGEARTLTEDDSYAAEQVAAGAMATAQAYAHPHSHHLTRWIGADADLHWRPRQVGLALPGRGRLVLCSDGLWNRAPATGHIAAAAGSGEPLSVARRLVAHANRRGGQDNVTVVVIDIPCSGGTEVPAQKGPCP